MGFLPTEVPPEFLALSLPYLNPPSQQQQEQQEGQHQLASVVAGSDPWVSGTTAVAEVIAEAGASIPIAVAAAAAAAPVSVVGGSSSWKDALLAQQAASPIAAADGLARAGQASIDVTGSRPSPQSSIAVAAATASTATAAAGPADMHGKLHTSTSSSRLSLSTPGPNSGTQRRVAAAAAARSAAAVDRAAGGRHGSGGRGRGRLNGRGRSRQRGADDPDGPMPQPPKLPPPPPPVCDSQGDLPPGLDPWPRLRPRVATDAGSACGAADNASDVSSTTAVAAATVTATTVPLAISMPASSRPTSPNLAMGASPPSPSQLQPPTAGGISWASVARGSGGGVTPPTAAAGQRPSTADSTNGGGGSAATRTAALKSPFELAAAAQPAAAVAEAGTQATAVAAGFVSSPFKASGELHHLLRNQPQPPPGAPTAPLLPPHSPAQPGRHGVNLNVDVGSVQDGGPSSFQFATGAAGPSALGRCGGAASAIISTGNSDCSSPVGRGAGGYAISGGGGHRTPRLGSPHGSGSVVLTAAAATCNMVTAAAANGTANGTGPQVNGHAANGANHQHNQNYHQNGTIILPPHQAAIGTVGTAFSAAAPVLQNASSLSTALSLGQDDLGLTRYGSYSLQGVDAFGDRGGGGGAVQEDSALLADPEVAELFRSIARDPFCWIRWQELSHGLRRGLSNMVGLGSIGQVFAGTYLHGEVAIKVIDINRETKYDLRALKAFKHEVDLNKRLNQHPNIVRFIGVCAEYILHAARQAGLLGDGPDPVDGPGAASGPSGHRSKPVSGPPMLAIVMEYCPMGTLFSMIGAAREVHTGTTRDRGTKWVQGTDFLWRWTRRLEVLKGAAAGLEYMHRCDVVHHDFTSYNLLLEEKNGQWITKVCDFNLSRVIARGRPGAALAVPNSGGAWSPRWQSPEYLGGHAYGCPSDVFSFAVVIWEVVTLQRPWDKELELQNARCESIAMINMYKDKKRLVFPEEVQPHLPVQAQLEDLCQRCWREDPQERPSMRQVADELMKLHEVVQEHERQLAAKARAAAAARLPPRGGAAAVPSAAAAASHTQFATNPSPPAALAAVGGSLADAGAPQGQGHVCGPPSPLPAPQEAAAPAAAVIASPPLPAPGPSRPRALVSPFAVAAGPRPSASPGTSPGTSPCPAPGPRLTPVSPFMTAQQNADP
ncbi:hypothetical protein Vretimale_18131 [Volvox reticuliferus]|uniref:Protein kinase domain-containing protein n=1 Tax=Volvox reticuliferus TaxID=1737510 RepID=A0A8J4GWH2_9CHLO|nr:hypothetical protein Vretimale_18131 [Volvox reticuliferus]